MEVRPAPIMYASIISAYPDMWQDASIIQTSYGIIHVIARASLMPKKNGSRI